MSTRQRQEWGTIDTTPEMFGRTVLGVPMEVWMPASGNGKILIFAGIHGEEPETTVLLSQVIRQMEAVSPHCAVVLAANPDGLSRGTRCNANGVDLNRNFPAENWSPEPVPYRWGKELPRDVSLSPGEGPGSEPETRAVVNLVESVEPEYLISIHAPLACIDDPDLTPLGKWISEKTELPHVEGVGYPTPGSFGSWALDRDLRLITYELPSASLEENRKIHGPVLLELLSNPSVLESVQ